jgi:hypothetical protein
MKSVNRQRMVHHRRRAASFIAGMRLLADDLAGYGHGAALLAVHSAISFADAALVATTGKRSSDQGHATAVKPLEKVCRALDRKPDGVKHLATLIRRKSDFAYNDAPVTENDIKAAILSAERFLTWVYRTFSSEFKDEDDATN